MLKFDAEQKNIKIHGIIDPGVFKGRFLAVAGGGHTDDIWRCSADFNPIQYALHPGVRRMFFDEKLSLGAQGSIYSPILAVVRGFEKTVFVDAFLERKKIQKIRPWSGQGP